MNRYKSALAAVAAAIGLTGSAHAAELIRSYDVVASNFADISGNPAPFGTIDIKFHLETDYGNNVPYFSTTGLTVTGGSSTFTDPIYLYLLDGFEGPEFIVAEFFDGPGNVYSFELNDIAHAHPFGIVADYELGGTNLGLTNYETRDIKVGVTYVGGTIAAVPEPTSWALMLVGFAGLGYALRRRRLPIHQRV